MNRELESAEARDLLSPEGCLEQNSLSMGYVFPLEVFWSCLATRTQPQNLKHEEPSPAPSSLTAHTPAGAGGRVNYLQRNLLMLHCLSWGSNHRAATSKIIPLPPLSVHLWRVHSVHLFNADQRDHSFGRWHRNMCTPSAQRQAPGALIPWQWVNFHSCSLSTHSK